MRLIRALIALLFIAVGVIVGALNPQPIVLDLGFITLHGTLGVSLLLALLLGAIAGGLMLAASVILPMRKQLRRARIQRGEAASAPPSGDP